MKQSIDVNTETYPNIVWGSCDPVNGGNLVLYSAEHCIGLEQAHVAKEPQYPIPEYNARIIFDGANFYQSTSNGGYRHVFRDEMSEGQTTIVRNVEFDESSKSWSILPSVDDDDITQTDVVFVIDTSDSMGAGDLYTKVYTEGCQRFLTEQKCLPRDVRFSAITFSNAVRVLYDNVDLKTTDIGEIQDKFKEIQPGGCTAYYDAVMKAIEMTDAVYQPGHEVILCTMTDGFDNSSRTPISQMGLKIKARKSMGWNIIMIGTTDIDVDAMSASNGIGRGASIGISNTTQGVSTAFRSLGRAVADVRSGASKGVVFTDSERQESAGAGAGAMPPQPPS
jgi:hypothetical protein